MMCCGLFWAELRWVCVTGRGVAWRREQFLRERFWLVHLTFIPVSVGSTKGRNNRIIKFGVWDRCQGDPWSKDPGRAWNLHKVIRANPRRLTGHQFELLRIEVASEGKR